MSAITKALSLLSEFSERRPHIGLTEFQRLTGRDKATLYRHLSDLTQMGLLDQDPRTRAYRLGHAVDRLAHMRGRTVNAADTVRPTIDAVSADLGEVVHLTVLSGDGLSTVYHADLGQQAVRIGFDPHWSPPLPTSSSGRCVLAFRSGAERIRLLRDQEGGRAQQTAFDAILQKISERGYAHSSDTVEVGVSSVGVPIFDADGQAQGALCAAYPTARDNRNLQRRALALLTRAAPTLSRHLGGEVPPAIARLWQPLCALEPARPSSS